LESPPVLRALVDFLLSIFGSETELIESAFIGRAELDEAAGVDYHTTRRLGELTTPPRRFAVEPRDCTIDCTITCLKSAHPIRGYLPEGPNHDRVSAVQRHGYSTLLRFPHILVLLSRTETTVSPILLCSWHHAQDVPPQGQRNPKRYNHYLYHLSSISSRAPNILPKVRLRKSNAGSTI